MDMMLISLAFVTGFILGGLISFVAMTKFSAKHKLMDEMTKLKRANASRDRMIVEFFENAQEQFSLLNKVYLNYAKFMQNNASRFMPSDTEFLGDDRVEDPGENKKVKEEKTKVAKPFVPETQSSDSFIPNVDPDLDTSKDTSSDTSKVSENEESQEKKDVDETAAANDLDAVDLKEKQPFAEKTTRDDGLENIIDDISVARIAEAASASRVFEQSQDSLKATPVTSKEDVSDDRTIGDEAPVKEQPKI